MGVGVVGPDRYDGRGSSPTVFINDLGKLALCHVFGEQPTFACRESARIVKTLFIMLWGQRLLDSPWLVSFARCVAFLVVR